MFIEWFNTSRYVYNRGLEGINNGEKVNFYDLRNKYVTSKNNDLVKEWEIKTPKDIRAGVLRDLVKAYKTAFSNLRNGNISKFNINYRNKRNGYHSIEIPKTAVSVKEGIFNIYKRYTKSPLKVCTEIKKNKSIEIKYDVRLQFTKYNEWYLLIPEDKDRKRYKTKSKCALDPGVRKFQTLYSEHEVKKINTNYSLINKLRHKISKYQKLRSEKIIRKSKMTKCLIKTWKRYINLINDMHYQTINYLTKTYKEIFLPNFESQKMVKKLNKTTRFNLLNLQHYKFQQRLLSKCEETNSTLTLCTEEYTSKTCTRCGEINNVGSSEHYKCLNCNLSIDRDINGSRNIYIKCIIP